MTDCRLLNIIDGLSVMSLVAGKQRPTGGVWVQSKGDKTNLPGSKKRMASRGAFNTVVVLPRAWGTDKPAAGRRDRPLARCRGNKRACRSSPKSEFRPRRCHLKKPFGSSPRIGGVAIPLRDAKFCADATDDITVPPVRKAE
jgi:hypothetical protein